MFRCRVLYFLRFQKKVDPTGVAVAEHLTVENPSHVVRVLPGARDVGRIGLLRSDDVVAVQE